MNSEAAQSRGPSDPSQDAPAPSAPADHHADRDHVEPDPDQTPAAEPDTAEMPITEPHTAQTSPTAPDTAPAPAAEPDTAEMPITEPHTAQTSPTGPDTARLPAAEPQTAEMPAADVDTARMPRADTGTGEVPPAWAPPADGVPEADEPLPPPTATGASGSGSPPPPPPPPGATTPPWWSGSPLFTREQLVRPRQGRYVAGVCAALARATNTDPVLWRVLVTVLGVVSGVGVLLYLIGWLVIPAEGDDASPIESLLGRGRSGMSPLSVIVLGVGAVLSFAFIVHDGMRAAILAAAVVIGAALLIKRTAPAARNGGTPPDPDPGAATANFAAAPTAAADEPVTAPLPPQPPFPPFAPPPGGYRPPFAPHGPYAPAGPGAYPPAPPPPAAKSPKPPRERSKLGRLTFFAVLVVLGVLAVLQMAGIQVAVSGYFAAALVTIAAGLIVGAWFGRARGLIALALLATLGLALSTGSERWGSQFGNDVYRPTSLASVADRYDFTLGNATLDLRGVDFTGQQQEVTATMKAGQLRILLPPKVDTTAAIDLQNGRAVIFGKEFDRRNIDGQTMTDLGADGTGGGTLRLDLQMNAGNLEVTR